MDSLLHKVFAGIFLFVAACSKGSSPSAVPTTLSEIAPPSSFELQTPVDGAPKVGLEPIFLWENATGAQGYRVEVALDDAFSLLHWVSPETPVSEPATVTPPPGALEPGTLYYWRAVAFSEAGEVHAENGPFSFQTVEDPSAPIGIQTNYKLEKSPGDPDYEESLVNLFFPPGGGPAEYGYPADSKPVVIVLRGGNSNSLLPGNPEDSASLATIDNHALKHGWIGVEPNYSVIHDEEDEDFKVAAHDIGRLIQYLRHHADKLGLDPKRIACLGRSAGAVHTYAIGLRNDLQDAKASDPVEWQSSRPDFCIAIAGPTHLPCFSPAASGMIDDLFIAGGILANASEAAKIESSPDEWLKNPEAFERAQTPPFCFAYQSFSPDICGTIFNPHSGLFGDWMKEAFHEFVVQTGDLDLGARSHWIDTYNLDVNAQLWLVSLWLQERFAGSDPQLFLDPIAGGVRVFGAAPGSSISFFIGSIPGFSALDDCPSSQNPLKIEQPILWDVATVPSSGILEWNLVLPAFEGSSPWMVQAVDGENCLSSNLLWVSAPH